MGLFGGGGGGGLANFLGNALPVVGSLGIPGVSGVANVLGNLLGNQGQQSPVAATPVVAPPVVAPPPSVVPPPVFNTRNEVTTTTGSTDIVALLKQYWYIPVGAVVLWFMNKKKAY